MAGRMSDSDWREQKRWAKSPAKKLYEEAERARQSESDLLAALKQALRESGCDGDLCAHRWHDTARATIARAEGG
jgi:hypothetical protein